MVNNSSEESKHSAGQPKNNLNKNGDSRGMHPNSLRNLKSGSEGWQPGQSGNPEGQSITARQKELMSEACPFDGQARTWLESLAESGMRQALTTPVALSNLQDRLEGKLTLPVKADIEGEGIKTFNFIMPDGSKFKASEFVNGNSD